ncbi:Sodium:solute symporter family-domain-containing protein [Fusarium redolens]|uniref:Sodium:solute symporter family-domain-containing protein n=1 Tax=Fusarium redolens TaxID=48865 RepID=A0A9P9KFC4_FUSRE|nr:Sodium:solute symporter family-domain-containing protein [Fusarium redolens]KAH7255150.1 Sodium:solute symporter family-domain-containing protein [Fusarium redolens]
MDLNYRSTETSVVPSPLPQSVGYGVVVAAGLAFAFGMMGLTAILKKTLNEDNSKVETFMVANRTVRTGLVASAVVSSWLWSTALLSCVLVTYSYGISGAFWYGAGCSTVIVFFGYLGTVCKGRVPEAHTILEVIRIRYGTVAHLSFTFLAIVNNLLNTINMILGASAAISFLTGMHIMASTFLLPLGVVLYTLVGGIKATFLTDYIHTFAILILSCWLTAKVITSESVGSIGRLYDLVVDAQSNHVVEGNYEGSLLTMTSQQGIYFAIILLTSNFGAVVMDTGYFLKAFAASPSAVVPGYVLGGISYFSIPWSLGTIVGMASLGLEALPIFPTYPRPMTGAEVTNGLALPYVAVAVAGKGGAVAVLLMTFMAVTSTLSAQILAVSSILTFDIYRVYFNREASNKQVIRWGHIGVVLFGVVAAAFTAMFHYIGVDMGWTLYMLGILTCPGVIPLIFTIIWRKQTKLAAISSAFLGMATGLGVWLGSAYAFSGEVTVASTGGTLPCMYGTVASLFSPLLYSVVITYLKPDNYDWSQFKEQRLAVEPDDNSSGSESSQSKGTEQVTTAETASNQTLDDNNQRRWTKYALWWAVATFLGHWVLWPLPMYAAKFIFSKELFTAWIVVSLIWLWWTLIMVGFYPIWNGRRQIAAVTRSIWRSQKS